FDWRCWCNCPVRRGCPRTQRIVRCARAGAHRARGSDAWPRRADPRRRRAGAEAGEEGAAMSWTLCVDFGTAFSKAAAAPSDSWGRFEPGLIRPLMLGGEHQGANTFLLPSAVFVDDARILFGPAAIARAAALADKKRTALKSFKTLLGVSDLDRALNTGLPASIDPHRLFS